MNPTLPDPFISHQTQPQQPPPPNMQQFRPPPFPLQQQPSRQGSGTMNELDALRVRCIELETELRLTKDQVIQAQSGTQYLVNCFAGQQNQGLAQGYGPNQMDIQDQYQQLQTEVHRLKGQLLLQQKSRIASPVPWGGKEAGWSAESEKARDAQNKNLKEEISVLKEQRASLLNDVLKLLKEDPHEYSFRFDDGDPAIYKPLEHFKDKLAASESKQTSLLDGDLLGESQGLGSPFDETKMRQQNRVDSPLSSPTPMAKKPRIYVKPGDFAVLDLDPTEQAKYERHAAREAAKTDNLRRSSQEPPLHHTAPRVADTSGFYHPVAQRPPTPPYNRRERRPYRGPHSFALSEKHFLMDNAIFIEEKDDEEYLEFWEGLESEVRRFAGRHTKEEWKSYYETTVRPEFLQRMAKRGAPVVEDDRAGQANKEEVIPARDAPVMAKVEEAANVGTTTNHAVTGTKAEAETEAVVAVAGTEKEPEAVHSTLAKAAGLAASQWAAPKEEVAVVPDAPQVARDVEEEPKPRLEIALSPKSRGVDKEEAIVTPSVPAFGCFDLLPPPKPVSSIPQAPIPGLAGDWPKPAPHLRGRLPRRPAPLTAEKDPATWNYLFCGIRRKSENHFILGQDEKLCRTVIICGIPVGTTLAEVLDQIRGGRIIGAKFFDTAGMKTSPPMTTNTVIVEFLGSQRAKDFVDHCAQHQIIFASGQGGEQGRAEVQLIRTQTIPLPQVLLADLHKADGPLTRVLFLIFFDGGKAPEPEALAREISAHAAKCDWNEPPKHPVRITNDEGGMLLFEYADVRQAASAWHAVGALEWKLGEVSKGFAADPCARALVEDEKEQVGEGGEKVAAEEERKPVEGLKEVVNELEAEAEARELEG